MSLRVPILAPAGAHARQSWTLAGLSVLPEKQQCLPPVVLVGRTVAGAVSGQLPGGPHSVVERLLFVLHHKGQILFHIDSPHLRSQSSAHYSMQASKRHRS